MTSHVVREIIERGLDSIERDLSRKLRIRKSETPVTQRSGLSAGYH